MTVFVQAPGLHERLSDPVINLHPFLMVQQKRTNDKALKDRLDAIALGFVPNTSEWHERFGTKQAVIAESVQEGRWLFGTGELDPITPAPESPT